MGTTRRFRNSIGPQLRRLRDARNLTQDKLAGMLQRAGLDLDRTAVAKIEAQLRSVFDYELAVLAQVLKVDPGELLPTRATLAAMLPPLLEGAIAVRKTEAARRSS